MARRGDPRSGSYDQAYKLRRGRQLWTGDGWAEVTAVRSTGESVLITVADGRVFRAGYIDAVLSRKAPPAPLAVQVSGVSGSAEVTTFAFRISAQPSPRWQSRVLSGL
jgi:hypothetical protein